MLNKDTIHTSLKSQLDITSIAVDVVWEPCAWSQTFKITDTSGTVYYLKGTPRNRSEVEVIQILHAYDAALIPHVLLSDLIPAHEWRWFLMSDKGQADYDKLPLYLAEKTAVAIGSLHQKVAHDTRIPRLLPHCLPSQFTGIMQTILNWMETDCLNPPIPLINATRTLLKSKQAFFENVTTTLAPLRPTCVHGDLWSGNIAVSEKHISLIDWGDAVWGIGTISIMNLLLSEDGKLPAATIWKSYEQGLQQAISTEIIHMSHIAYFVTSLVIENQLAGYGSTRQTVPIGIPPILDEVIRLVSQM